MKLKNILIGIWIVIVGTLGFWAVVLYVAYHFLSKWW